MNRLGMKNLIKRSQKLLFYTALCFFMHISYSSQPIPLGTRTATIHTNSQFYLQFPGDSQEVHDLLAQGQELLQRGNVVLSHGNSVLSEVQDIAQQVKKANTELSPKMHKIADTVLGIFAAIKAFPQDGFLKNSGRFCIAITGAAGPILLMNGVNNAAQAINNFNDAPKRKEFTKKSLLSFFASYLSFGITITYCRN